MNTTVAKELTKVTTLAIKAIECEATGLFEVAAHLKEDSALFVTAITYIVRAEGRVIICGMGKSGIVGQKIAASLASTGTPAFSLHPGEAFHGDLGMIKHDDIFIALSNSGETEEVLKLLPFLECNGNVIISLTKNHDNTLARAATVNLRTGVSKEACPLQLAPTSSTTATMAMGDAITIALIHANNFQPADFARFHPGGSLGKKLSLKVIDVMVKDNLPFIKQCATVNEVIHAMSKGKLGLAIIGTPDSVVGIITDGDVRRYIANKQVDDSPDIFDYMTRHPSAITSSMRFGDAVEQMEECRQTSLLVMDITHSRVVGVVQK
jgi:arabinose-5-phosphate isomerase